MAKQQTIPPFAQAMILLSLLGAGMVLGIVIVYAIAKLILHIPLMQLTDALTSPAHVQFARVAQALVSFFMLALPAFFLGLILNRKPLKYIGFSTLITGKQFFIVVLIAFGGLLASDALGNFNEWIPIPKAAAHYFKQLEDSYDDQLMSLATMKTVADLIISLIVLAFLPAMFEEMFFRGALQQTMIGITRNAFWGILITAILFSGFHLSYYGFLPRAFIGVVLGYIFYYGKNIWLNISVHFLNNALAVTQMYVLSKEGKLTPDTLNQTSPYYVGILGIIGVIFLLIIFKRESQVVISMNSLKRNDDERMA